MRNLSIRLDRGPDLCLINCSTQEVLATKCLSVAQERLSKHRWYQDLKKQKQLRPRVNGLSGSVIQWHDGLQRYLPTDCYIREPGIHRRPSLLPSRRVE